MSQKKERLLEFIAQKNYKVAIQEFSPEEVCKLLSYKDAMIFGDNLCFGGFFESSDYVNEEFAVQLFFEIRKQYLNEWNKDWKNDHYLSFLCLLTCRYKE